MENIRGFRIKGNRGLSHWAPLLEEWMLATERFCRVSKGADAPYAYTERAHVGLLAAAAWHCGWIALEEFQHEKGVKYRPKWGGRGDLYLVSNGRSELVEAKFRWLSFRANKFQELATQMLAEAVDDARHANGAKDFSGVGVAFLSFYAPPSSKKPIIEHINPCVEKLLAVKSDAVAWCFPRETRGMENDSGEILPGTAMLIRDAELPEA